MITEDFKPEGIRALNKFYKRLEGVAVELPSLVEQEKAKDIIEKILPPDEGEVNMDYVRRVLIALKYVETHFPDSMLDDIKAGKEINISEYK
ncbi:MAG: hypothetical protein NC313_09890 [Butyrivibrio sp.]|nr:hypothetical protein [Butyrivibrio sp.]